MRNDEASAGLPTEERREASRRRALLVTTAVILAGTYALPFYGFWLSLLLLVLPVLTRDLWPTVSRRTSSLCALLAVAGLWHPAMLDLFTPLLYNAGITVSMAWLIIPLCSPDTLASVLIPAAAATAVCFTGLGLAVRNGRPWAWVLAAWLAPWAYQAVMSLVPTTFGC